MSVIGYLFPFFLGRVEPKVEAVMKEETTVADLIVKRNQEEKTR